MEDMFERMNQAIKELDSAEPETRQLAAKKLQHFQHEKIYPYLVKLIKEDEYPLTRISAIQCLTAMKVHSSIKAILEVAQNDVDKGVRLTAIESLGLLKEPMAIDTLNKIVNRSDDNEIIKAASLSIQIIQGLTPEWSHDHG